MNDLDDRLRRYYRSLHIDTAPMIGAQMKRGATPNSAGLRWLAYGMAASILVLLSFAVTELSLRREQLERTFREAALNHTANLSLEYQASSIDIIDDRMSLLPFELALPRALDESYAVLGSRYCSIGGHLAAHVKLIDRRTNERISVFMTEAVDELRDIDITGRTLKGLSVRLLREDGLFYVMARPAR